MDQVLDITLAGRPVRYARHGQAGPTVVVVHGAGADRRAWARPAALLAHAGCLVLAPDLAGHGGSAGPALESVPDMARWLLDLLDAAGVGDCALAGHSMGSLVALHAAALAPQRVGQLLLVGTAAPMRVSPRLLELARDDPERAVVAVATWSHDDGDSAGVAQTLAGMRAAGAAALLATDLAACAAYAEGEAMAARVRARTRLLLGARDRMTPPAAALALGAALGAEIDQAPCGHALLDQAPDAVARAMLRLLSPV